jgi:hypothetical protein
VHLTFEIFHMINITFSQHNLICSTKDQGSSLGWQG